MKKNPDCIIFNNAFSGKDYKGGLKKPKEGESTTRTIRIAKNTKDKKTERDKKKTAKDDFEEGPSEYKKDKKHSDSDEDDNECQKTRRNPSRSCKQGKN
jgi:hypothetical protein